MDNEKQILKHLPLCHPFFPGSISLLHSQLLYLTQATQREWGAGGGSQPITAPLCHSFLHTCPLLQCGSFHGLQYFRTSLLLCGFSTEARAHARRTCSSVGPAWAAFPSGNIHLLHHGVLHGLHCGRLLWHSPPWAAEKHLLYHLEHLVLFLHLWCLQSCISHFFPHCAALCSFLNTFSQRCHQLCWWSQLLPMAGPLWRQPLVSSHRGHPRKQPLATATQHSQAVHGWFTQLTLLLTCHAAKVSRDLQHWRLGGAENEPVEFKGPYWQYYQTSPYVLLVLETHKPSYFMARKTAWPVRWFSSLSLLYQMKAGKSHGCPSSWFSS